MNTLKGNLLAALALLNFVPCVTAGSEATNAPVSRSVGVSLGTAAGTVGGIDDPVDPVPIGPGTAGGSVEIGTGKDKLLRVLPNRKDTVTALTIAAWKRLWDDLTYGNWTGPGWSGGVKGGVGDKGPVDSLDEIAMRHDMAWDHASEQGKKRGNEIEALLKRRADALYIREAYTLPLDPSEWPLKPLSDVEAAKVRQLTTIIFVYVQNSWTNEDEYLTEIPLDREIRDDAYRRKRTWERERLVLAPTIRGPTEAEAGDPKVYQVGLWGYPVKLSDFLDTASAKWTCNGRDVEQPWDQPFHTAFSNAPTQMLTLALRTPMGSGRFRVFGTTSIVVRVQPSLAARLTIEGPQEARIGRAVPLRAKPAPAGGTAGAKTPSTSNWKVIWRTDGRGKIEPAEGWQVEFTPDKEGPARITAEAHAEKDGKTMKAAEANHRIMVAAPAAGTLLIPDRIPATEIVEASLTIEPQQEAQAVRYVWSTQVRPEGGRGLIPCRVIGPDGLPSVRNETTEPRARLQFAERLAFVSRDTTLVVEFFDASRKKLGESVHPIHVGGVRLEPPANLAPGIRAQKSHEGQSVSIETLTMFAELAQGSLQCALELSETLPEVSSGGARWTTPDGFQGDVEIYEEKIPAGKKPSERLIKREPRDSDVLDYADRHCIVGKGILRKGAAIIRVHLGVHGQAQISKKQPSKDNSATMSANAKRVASELATLAQDVRVVSVEEKTTAPPEKPSYRAAVKKSLSGNTIVIGGTIGFQAELFLNGKPQPGDYLYAWQPRPDVTFAPDGNRSSTVTATFNVPGKHPVLVSILDPASNVTLAESERIEMEVVGPKVEIRMEGEPPARPGREAQLRAVCEPDVSADIVEFKWEIAKGNAKAGRTDEGGKVFHLTPRDTKPLDVTLSLLARNEEIGKATWQATPEASKVTISEPKPVARADSLNWTPGVGVTATRPPLEQGEQATVEATVEPEPDKDKVRYVWTVQPAEGLRIGLDTSRMPLIEANRAGTYTLTVAVGDNDKSKLGEASRTVTVVPQGEGRSGEKTLKKMEGAKKDKEQKERKDRADAVWKEAKGAYAAGDLGKAEEKCKESLGIEPTDERGTFTRSLEKANALWRDGETLEKAGRTEEALAKYKESIQPPLPTSSARQDHVRKLEKGSQPPSQPGPGVGQTKPGPESAASASGDRRIEVSRAVGVALTALPDGRRVEQVVRVYYKLSVTTGHRARLSVRGTDGFSQTVEGLSSVILDRAMPRGRVADTIVGEDADMPGCSATQTREYE